MLDTYYFWQQTWQREGRMEVSLPQRNDSDGAHLAAQARYALVLDMITRTGEEFWPRYGTAPGCKYCLICFVKSGRAATNHLSMMVRRTAGNRCRRVPRNIYGDNDG